MSIHSDQAVFTPGDFTFWFDARGEHINFVICYKGHYSKSVEVIEGNLRAIAIQEIMTDLIILEDGNG